MFGLGLNTTIANLRQIVLRNYEIVAADIAREANELTQQFTNGSAEVRKSIAPQLGGLTQYLEALRKTASDVFVSQANSDRALNESALQIRTT